MGDGDDDDLSGLAAALEEQGEVCARAGSPLYGRLLAAAAFDARTGGAVAGLLDAHYTHGRSGALGLRLMAAVQRFALLEPGSSFARVWPSTAPGPASPEAIEAAFLALISLQSDRLDPFVSRPCQTNEVGRAAALWGGLLAAAAEFRLPLALVELGASAGLNLRLDHFGYGDGRQRAGPPDSPVRLIEHWIGVPQDLGAPLEVVERLGCDRAPLDPGSGEDQLALRSSLWADQPERFALLEGALALARAVPATVERSDLAPFLARELEHRRPGRTTVVYQSVLDEYLTPQTRRERAALLAAAGRRATRDAPFAVVELEPGTSLRDHDLHVTLWPPGERRHLATSGPHGAPTRWLTR